MRLISVGALAAVAVLMPAPAAAAWHKATSKHFVIYANDDARGLREFAVKLEKFDKAVRLTREMDDPPVGDGNRLTIFFVGSQDDVGRLASRNAGADVAGFYLGRVEGSIAVVPRAIGNGLSNSVTSDAVLFHEYAHHLMLSQIDRVMPAWLVEGFAEFMSTATIEKDGGVQLGWAPQFRAQSLGGRMITPLPTLLGTDHSRLQGMASDQFYGTAWLLTHFLTFEPARRGQLNNYVTAIAKGSPPMNAATSAFGDLKVLNRDLLGYLAKSRLSGIRIPVAAIGQVAVEVQALSPGAAAVMNDRIRSKVGVNQTTAGPVAARVRAVAARFPGDLLVERTLAEAEFDLRNYAAAEAAADRALKIDPRDTEALVFKGKAIFAGTRPDRAVAARKWFVSANKIDPEDPEPLLFFYRSFGGGGARPHANAIAALHYASDLAPQDLGLRMTSAMQYLSDGKFPEGRVRLASVAFNPHAGALAVQARDVLAKFDAADANGALKLLTAKSKAADEAEAPGAKP